MKDDIIVGLDLGSTAVRLVIGQKVSGPTGEELQIIGAVSTPAAGISKGVVNSIEDTTSSISACLENAERVIGIPITNVFVGVNDFNVKCEHSHGVVAVSKADGEINESDVARAIEAARTVAIPPNYEILHVMPIRFSVDSQTEIKDPIGMSGTRLEVEALIILGLVPQIKNLTKAVFRTNLEIDDLVLAPLAAAEASLSNQQKELGVVLINIGASTTSIAVYEERNLLHVAVLPIGSEHITKDVALGLKCPINLAERIKLEYGNANPANFTDEDQVDVSDLVKEEEVNDDIDFISLKYVSEIIEARVEEILVLVDNELKKIDRSGLLAAGAIFTGAGSQLEGLIDIAKRILKLPAALGQARNLSIVVDKVKSPEFIPALGLVVWGANDNPSQARLGMGKYLGKLNKAIKNIIKNIIPK